MKNNLSDITLDKTLNAEERLVTCNDVIELMVMNKIQRGEFDDIFEQWTSALGSDCDQSNDEDCDSCDDCESSEVLVDRRLLNLSDSNSRRLVCAGYTDCMDEAIRFLVEEENISPEHPVVRNLKAHLEQSRERIFEKVSETELRRGARHTSTRVPDLEPNAYREFLVGSQCAWNAV